MALTTHTTDDLVVALDGSRGRLAELVRELPEATVAGPSYCSEWTVAQVLSHLGSGAEIWAQIVDAGLAGGEAPGPESFPPVWDRWNAKGPAEVTTDLVDADEALIGRLQAVDPAQRERWRLDLFGETRSLADLLAMRLAEHTLHSWDVAVVVDPAATLDPGAVAQLIDGIGLLVARVGRTPDEPLAVDIETTGPARRFRLTATEDGVTLEPSEATAPPDLRLPAEALIRLIYGRLDPDHTPAGVETPGADLDALRALFPGF